MFELWRITVDSVFYKCLLECKTRFNVCQSFTFDYIVNNRNDYVAFIKANLKEKQVREKLQRWIPLGLVIDSAHEERRVANQLKYETLVDKVFIQQR